jgi:FkbM family methyltransferase
MVYPREGLTGYWYLGFPDYEEMMFLSRFLRSGDRFYDVGANAGAFAVLATSMGCPVVAFEPVPVTFSRLIENAMLNRDLGSITCLEVAVGAGLENFLMTTGQGTGNHVLKPGETAESIEVTVTTLDDVAGTHGFPSFIKMDVEGHELEALKGAESVLRSTELHGLLLETFRPHNWEQPKLRAIEGLLREQGFLPFEYDVTRNEIIPLDQPQDGGSNTLYFRSPDFIRDRLRTSS